MSLNKKLLHTDFLIFIDYKLIFISFKIHFSYTFYFEIIFESFRKKISEFRNKKIRKIWTEIFDIVRKTSNITKI